ncbi:M20/M25/M40 family metallo-hydrolase [Pendulispora albinea]|uniref:M20/M25/M40 family metallo-hydrolase n=1 Tax=Pendulispora albinea TaxID=2741071 RepID=A0ABZ2M1E5_9BACT
MTNHQLGLSGLLLASVALVACQPAWSMPPAVARLEDLVRIPSGTANIAGVDAVQERVANDLRKLGFTIQWIANPRGERASGKLLVATLRGTDARFVTLVTHADTVFESPGKFEISGDSKVARGPGVIDAKGGTVVALLGLERFLAKTKPRLSIRFVSSPSEETGSAGFLDDFRRFARDSAMVLGFEPALAPHGNGSSVICKS